MRLSVIEAFLGGVFREKERLSQWLVFFQVTSDPSTFTDNRKQKTDGANIIRTEKTIWPSQHAIFELFVRGMLRFTRDEGKFCAIC